MPEITFMQTKTLKKKTVPEHRSVRVESGDVYLIQRNVPVAGTFRSLGPHLRYPFSEMQIGESFEVKVTKADARRRVSNLSSACASYVKSRNKAAKFTVRRTGDTTIRVWRVK